MAKDVWPFKLFHHVNFALYASELEFQVEFELTLVELMFQPKQMFHMCNIEV